MVIALVVSATFAASGVAAQQQGQKPENKKRSKQEQQEIDTVVKMADTAMASMPPSPPSPSAATVTTTATSSTSANPTTTNVTSTLTSGTAEGAKIIAQEGDIKMSLEPFFMKSQEQRTFVPFVLNVDNAPPNVILYVRVVDQGYKPDPKVKKVEYPWDDVHFIPSEKGTGAFSYNITTTSTTTTSGNTTTTQTNVTGAPAAPQALPQRGSLNRVFMARAGTYDVYLVMKERIPEKAPKNTVPKTGILKTVVTVPDYYNGELATSTILVADTVNMLTAPPSPDEARERPFVFGLQELLPATDMEFKKAEELSIFFQVYNSGLDAAGKPNLTLEYEFHKAEGTGEKFFNRTTPQAVNGTNLPPQFDPAKFPVPGGISVPLASFTEGSYRLNVKITDKANNNKVLSQDIKFTVKG